MNNIRQGETFDFTFTISGETSLTGTFDVMQYPGDTPAISRALTKSGTQFSGTLTAAETAALAIGQWFVHATGADADEEINDPIKLYISKGWV